MKKRVRKGRLRTTKKESRKAKEEMVRKKQKIAAGKACLPLC